MSEVHVALKQKLNTIAVKCKDELHAPKEIMVLASNTVVPQNEQQRCYLECVYTNLNLIKNNKFSMDDGDDKALQPTGSVQEDRNHNRDMRIRSYYRSEKCAAGRVIRKYFVKNREKINFFPKA